MLNWLRDILLIGATALATKVSASASEPKIEINSCSVRVSNAGLYHLSSETRNYFSPVCTVKILSPAGTRVRLTFDKNGYSCSPNSLVTIIDGWNIFDSLRKRSQMVPRSAKDISSTAICGSGTPPALSTSQNMAEIYYALKPGEDLLFEVEFMPLESSCNAMLSPSDADRPLVMTAESAATCRLLLPGGIRLKIKETKLPSEQTTKCGTEGSSYLRVRMGDSFFDMTRGQTMCGGEKIPEEFLLPCKLSVLELHSAVGDRTSATVEFEMADYSDVLKYSAFCY